jgi:hypothetical protein
MNGEKKRSSTAALKSTRAMTAYYVDSHTTIAERGDGGRESNRTGGR